MDCITLLVAAQVMKKGCSNYATKLGADVGLNYRIPNVVDRIVEANHFMTIKTCRYPSTNVAGLLYQT